MKEGRHNIQILNNDYYIILVLCILDSISFSLIFLLSFNICVNISKDLEMQITSICNIFIFDVKFAKKGAYIELTNGIYWKPFSKKLNVHRHIGTSGMEMGLNSTSFHFYFCKSVFSTYYNLLILTFDTLFLF